MTGHINIFYLSPDISLSSKSDFRAVLPNTLVLSPRWLVPTGSEDVDKLPGTHLLEARGKDIFNKATDIVWALEKHVLVIDGGATSAVLYQVVQPNIQLSSICVEKAVFLDKLVNYTVRKSTGKI